MNWTKVLTIVLALITFFFVYIGIYHLSGGYIFTTLYFLSLMTVLYIAGRNK